MKKIFVKIFSLVCLLVLCGSLLTIGYAVDKCPYYVHYDMANLEEYDPPYIEELYQNLDDQKPWIDGDGNEGMGHNYEKIHHYRCKICKCDIEKMEEWIIDCPHTWGKRTYSGGMDWQTCSGCKVDRTLKHDCSFHKQEDAGKKYSGREQGDSVYHYNIYKVKKKCTACKKEIVTQQEIRERVRHTIKTVKNQVSLHLTYITETCTVCGYKRTRTVYN